MLRKFFIICILLLFSVNIYGCDQDTQVVIALINSCQEKTNPDNLDTKQEEFTKQYADVNDLNSTISKMNLDTVQKKIANDSKAADTYKEIDGYSNVCGIMSANNGIIINGNVAVYGGFYTQGDIQMANGAVAVVDTSYIDKIATYPMIYNGEVFLSDILEEDNYQDVIKPKPVDIQHVKRRIKLINISEVSNDEN